MEKRTEFRGRSFSQGRKPLPVKKEVFLLLLLSLFVCLSLVDCSICLLVCLLCSFLKVATPRSKKGANLFVSVKYFVRVTHVTINMCGEYK